MKEHFISFITPMVQAIREGRKTQTRRILDTTLFGATETHESIGAFKYENGGWRARSGDWNVWSDPVRLYEPGDILKVKEAAWMWCEKVRDGLTPKKRPKFRYVPVQGKPVIYVADHADGTKKPTAVVTEGNEVFGSKVYCWRYKIPRFLPAWAIRTRLEVVSVRMERLNEISEDDARAEGIEEDHHWDLTNSKTGRFVHFGETYDTARDAFRALWQSINGQASWDADPWVRRIEFKPL